VGFNAASLKKGTGLGLVSMQERTRLMQGTFSIESRPGRGVNIRIEVPISKEKHK
jgi:signal transduction histidine kinase